MDIISAGGVGDCVRRIWPPLARLSEGRVKGSFAGDGTGGGVGVFRGAGSSIGDFGGAVSALGVSGEGAGDAEGTRGASVTGLATGRCSST